MSRKSHKARICDVKLDVDNVYIEITEGSPAKKPTEHAKI